MNQAKRRAALIRANFTRPIPEPAGAQDLRRLLPAVQSIDRREAANTADRGEAKALQHADRVACRHGYAGSIAGDPIPRMAPRCIGAHVASGPARAFTLQETRAIEKNPKGAQIVRDWCKADHLTPNALRQGAHNAIVALLERVKRAPDMASVRPLLAQAAQILRTDGRGIDPRVYDARMSRRVRLAWQDLTR